VTDRFDDLRKLWRRFRDADDYMLALSAKLDEAFDAWDSADDAFETLYSGSSEEEKRQLDEWRNKEVPRG
jgi:hypothetical protein